MNNLQISARQIVERLKAHDLSEYEIAKRTPVSQSTVNRISTGETTNPSYRTVQELLKLLAECEKPRKRAAPALNA